jgi:steroid 5-alpha reductase family enzyme
VGSVAWMPMLVALAAAAVTIGVLMLVVLALSARSGNWSVIDTFWGLGFVSVAVVSYLVTWGHGDGGRRLVALLVPVIWGLRLAAYLHWRNHGRGEDPRYTALMARRTGALVPFAVKNIFWAQGWVMWVVATPVVVAMAELEPVNAVTWLGVGLAVFGFFFEVMGDAQLARFKANPANAGKILDTGLWAWTRHPNYFGDICVMFAFWLVACGAWVGVATVFAPLLMTRMLVSRTGKALTEKRMARSRGPQYAAYVARTSGLVPRPPRQR